jgi:hypothetical protein
VDEGKGGRSWNHFLGWQLRIMAAMLGFRVGLSATKASEPESSKIAEFTS